MVNGEIFDPVVVKANRVLKALRWSSREEHSRSMISYCHSKYIRLNEKFRKIKSVV